MSIHDRVHRAHGAWATVRARLALRGVEVAGDLKIAGVPGIEAEGRIRLGRGVSLICRPERVRIVAKPGASIEIGDGVEIGSGALLFATRSIVVGAGATLGAGCELLDADAGADGRGIVIGERAIIGAGMTLRSGAEVAAASRMTRPIDNGLASQGGRISLRSELASPGEVRDQAIDAEARGVLSSLLPAAREAGLDDPLRQLAGWDSLSSIHALVALEKAFGVALPSDFFDCNATLRSVEASIAARRAVQP